MNSHKLVNVLSLAILLIGLLTAAVLVARHISQRRALRQMPFNTNVVETKPVYALLDVRKELITYEGVEFRGTWRNTWFFTSHWSLCAASASTGEVTWRLAETTLSQSATDDGLLLIGGYDHGYAVAAGTGDILWDFVAKGEAFSLPPVATEHLVYFSTSEGAVFAVDRKSGKQVWSHASPGGLLASPVPFDSLTVLLSDRNILAVDSRGQERWSVELQFGKPCWARVIGELICVRSSGAELHGIRKDGTIAFTRNVEADPAMGGSMLYWGLTGGVLEAYDSASLANMWSSRSDARLVSGPVIHGRTLFYVTANGDLWALASDTGKSLWSTNLAKAADNVALALGDSYVCVLVDGKDLYTVDMNTGRIRWTVKLDQDL
ncbi:MAG TPA: PQQ-binding-like beta-propeller repeat protein, partial [Armatimonadota bacterium]|nr:PQQ-binding-like beta-propeller repeat protein [Armatimonadota bacterium]